MDTIPLSNPMDDPPHTPLDGLDPAELLRQGAADDTFVEGAGPGFCLPSLGELASLFPQLEILEIIGQGGMGAVYKARQKELDRIVAVKILPPAIGQSEAFSNRFAREAKALAKLNHAGIVTIYEFGQADGLYYILMEFVDGVNLAQLMKTGRISPREALAIVPQICDALQFAHDQGIVHRDIKPENILLDRLGRVKVADFGIAKLIGADEFAASSFASGEVLLTEVGKIMGTPQYMAPEQIDHPSEVDHRADIYALGVVFYQMLTGELPGKRVEAPSRKVHIDVRLDEIVLRAMEKDPELRFQQVSVMKTRVDDLGAETVEVPEVKPEPPTVKSRSTGRMVAIGCGVFCLIGVLALFVLAAVFWLLTPKRNEAVEREVQASRRAQEEFRAKAQAGHENDRSVISDSPVRAAQVFPLERGGALGGVDLDTGKFVNFAPTGGIDDPAAAVRWREENGIDLLLDLDSARPGVLVGGTQVKDVAAEWWDDTPEPGMVEAVLPPWEKKSLFDERMTFLAAEGPSSGTRTHVCRTLAGSVGILRIGPTHTASGVRAEWRMIVNRHSEKDAVSSVTIMLNADGSQNFQGEPVSDEVLRKTLENLKAANPNLAVTLRTDERLSYSRVIEMLDRLAKLGIANVAFATEPGKDGPRGDVPQLRRLDWQDQVEACAGEAWLPSGEVDRSNDWMPPIGRVKISQTKAAKENPRFLCLWFSHPLFDRQSVAEISLLDADGKKSLELPTREKAIGAIPAAPENANTGWITVTLCAGKKGQIPPKATVILRYSGGAWQFWTEIAPDFRGTRTLGDDVMLSDPGQNSDGNAFIQITRGASADEQFDFVAITRDGRRHERNAHSESATGKVSTERFSFDTPLSQVKSFECRKRPIHGMSWPVVLKETAATSGKMKIDFDRAGDSMQNIVYRFQQEYGGRLCFENLDFDMKQDTMTLGRRISMLEEKQRDQKLTAREVELLKDARRLRKEEKLGDETVIDVGERYEGNIVADSIEDFLNQLTKDTPYDWTSTDGKGSWVVLPRAGTRLNYPVTLDTGDLTVEEAVAKVIEQRPAGSEIGVGQVDTRPVAPGTDSDPWLHVKCKPANFVGIPAWRALCMIGEGARPDSLWELAGYKEHRMLGIFPGSGMEHPIVSEAQAWLVAIDRGDYPKSLEQSAGFFRTKVTLDQWRQSMESSRKSLGEVKSRKLRAATEAKSSPDAPDGRFLVMEFHTEFAAGKAAAETVTFMQEPDGIWRFAGYSLNPASAVPERGF